MEEGPNSFNEKRFGSEEGSKERRGVIVLFEAPETYCNFY